MPKIAYTLSTCDTSKRILKNAHISSPEFEIRDIKTQAITEAELDQMKAMSGNYESLFSRRAQKYRAMELKDKELSENEIRALILQEYTFLKRPVIIINEKIFIGNTKKNIELLMKERGI